MKRIRGEITGAVSDGGHELHENYRAMAIAKGVYPQDPLLKDCRGLTGSVNPSGRQGTPMPSGRTKLADGKGESGQQLGFGPGELLGGQQALLVKIGQGCQALGQID